MNHSEKILLQKAPSFIEIYKKNKASQTGNLLFDQYKLFLDQDSKIRDQRQQRNTFFLTSNSLIISILGTFLDKHALGPHRLMLILFLLILGIGCAMAWVRTLNAFHLLTNKSYLFIKAMEAQLGSPVFTEFYEHLHPAEDQKERRTFLTALEKMVPYLFLMGYGIYILIDLSNLVKMFHQVF